MLEARREGPDTVIIALAGAAALGAMAWGHRSTPYDAVFAQVAGETGVPRDLLRAIARVESGFNPNAVGENKDGTGRVVSRDYGLMQLNEANLRRYGLTVADAMDPVKSVRTAARLLLSIKIELGARFNAYTWVMAYNVGSDLQPATRGEAYASKVTWHWTLYQIGGLLA